MVDGDFVSEDMVFDVVFGDIGRMDVYWSCRWWSVVRDLNR